MAKIVDPDQLSYTLGTATTEEIEIDTTAKTIRLLPQGNLDDSSPGRDSGVTLQALYSKLKEIWRTDATLNKFRFPLDPIFEAKFDWVNGWAPDDQQTRDLIRDAGWLEIDASEYACLVSLGDVNADTDASYYQQIAGFDLTADGSVSAFDKTGELNEAIQIKGTGGTPNYTGFTKVFLRVQGKTYDQANLISDLGLTALTYVAYSFPLSNDLDITDGSGPPESDTNIDTLAPYTGMSVSYLQGSGFTDWANSTLYPAGAVVRDGGRWYFTAAGGTSSGTGVGDDIGVTWESYAGERQIGANWYAFNRIVEANGGSKKEVYEWYQRQLRKSSDINADLEGSPNQDGFGAVYGRIATRGLYFIGSVLHTEGGVYIDNFDVNDTNDIVHHDITVNGGGLDSEYLPVTSTNRPFPFVAAGTLVFNSFLTAEPDVDTRYTMYFADPDGTPSSGDEFDSAGAIIVDDNSGTDIDGQITATSIPFDFDYDGNSQGGRTPGTDADVYVVAIGKAGAQWVVGQFTITRSTGQTFPLNAAQERVYSNP